jgi:hypothetical protein
LDIPNERHTLKVILSGMSLGGIILNESPKGEVSNEE